LGSKNNPLNRSSAIFSNDQVRPSCHRLVDEELLSEQILHLGVVNQDRMLCEQAITLLDLGFVDRVLSRQEYAHDDHRRTLKLHVQFLFDVHHMQLDERFLEQLKVLALTIP